MSGVYYFESFNALLELPFVTKLAKLLSKKGGGDEVIVVSENSALGSKTEGVALSVYEVLGDLVEETPIEDVEGLRALYNKAVLDNTPILINTHNAVSKALKGEETLLFRPLYGKDTIFFLDRTESRLTLDIELRGQYNQDKLSEITASDRVYRVGGGFDEDNVAHRIRQDIIYSIEPLIQRKDNVLTLATQDGKVVRPKTDCKTRILMSRDNPEGLLLEDVLTELVNELEIKQGYIEQDRSVVAMIVKRNNEKCMELLKECAKLQTVSRNILATVGRDQGPSGEHRLKVKSSG